MANATMNVSENYLANTILTQAQLNAAIGNASGGTISGTVFSGPIEHYLNNHVYNNLEQLRLDIFGSGYSYDNDGLANQATALRTEAALLADNETVTGNWTFSGTVTLSSTVTSSSTFTSTGQARVRGYRTSTNQTISNSAVEAITLNAETYDVATMHDNSTNPTRLTIPTGQGGGYIFHGQVTFAANATGRREVYIYKNGSEIAERKEFAPSATEQTTLQVACHDTAVPGDYYEMQVFQSSGAGLDAVLGERVTFFSTMKVW